jgi:hypothetical protein
MKSLDSLISAINGGLIERLVIPYEQDFEAVLDERDSEEFADKWMAAFRSVEAHKEASPKTPAFSDLITKIREAAYLHAFTRWKSPDLAAYISDDFGLIADALATETNDPWIMRLLQSYQDGAIPTTGTINHPD